MKRSLITFTAIFVRSDGGQVEFTEFINKLSLTGNNTLEAVQRWRAYTGRRFAAVRGSNIHFKVHLFHL